MRFVKVFHSEFPDFVIVVPDEVEDTDKYLDAILHGAAGWGEAKGTLCEAIQETLYTTNDKC